MKSVKRSTFLKRVHDTIRHYDMIKKGDKVLAAVSGGPDSVCLLRALIALRGKLGIEIVVANMDHGIRGSESRRDSDFVKSLAEETELDLVHEKTSIKTSKSDKCSIEEKAREKRYAFLEEAARKSGCNVLATGHTIDDQAETVLMRILNGSSFSGIAGIPPVRYAGELKIIRPLIRTEKSGILGYLKDSKARFVKDSTNKDKRILRNAIRLEAIPFFEKYNPKLRRSLANLADSVREDVLYLNEEKARASAFMTKGRSELSVRLADLIMQPRALKKEVFKEAVTRSGGNIKKLTYRHWMDMEYLIRAGEKGKSLDLPGDIRVTKGRDKLIFRKGTTP